MIMILKYMKYERAWAVVRCMWMWVALNFNSPHPFPRCPALQQGHQVPHLVIVASHLQHQDLLPGDGMDHHGKYIYCTRQMLAWPCDCAV